MAQQVRKLTGIHVDEVLIPSLTGVLGFCVAMSIGVGCRRGLNPALLWLWLWLRPAAAVLIQPLAWELPYAAVVALKSKKGKEK